MIACYPRPGLPRRQFSSSVWTDRRLATQRPGGGSSMWNFAELPGGPYPASFLALSMAVLSRPDVSQYCPCARDNDAGRNTGDGARGHPLLLPLPRLQCSAGGHAAPSPRKPVWCGCRVSVVRGCVWVLRGRGHREPTDPRGRRFHWRQVQPDSHFQVGPHHAERVSL